MVRTVLVGLVALVGCEATRDASERAAREAGAVAERTQQQAGELVAAAGERTADAARSAAEQTQQRAGELVAAAGERTADAARAARDWAVGLTAGELSATVQDWLRRGAEASGEGIEAVLRRGEQAVPAALEVGKALASAVDGDTMIEPIYQQVGAGGDLALRRGEADAAIRGMPRVEVIDGLQVGFKQLSSLDLGHRVQEQAFLVVWRQDDRLIGLVYRSRRDVDLGQLVALAPRLIGLVRAALG
jgi:hypothetical protein